MKRITLNNALKGLKNLKQGYQDFLKKNFEDNAKDCRTCEVQGICCLDAHFVNVHITRLEALAILKTLGKLSSEKQKEIYQKNQQTIREYGLSAGGDTFSQTFACPLFEKGTGCLVHGEAKPLPCISHACYEKKEDLPPSDLQLEREKTVERLNRQTFGNAWNWLPLPVWLEKIRTDSVTGIG